MISFLRRHRVKIHAGITAIAMALGLVFFAGLLPAGKSWVTIKVGGPHGTKVQTLSVPSSAIAEVQASDVADHQGMRDETPAGAPRSVIEAAREQQDALAANDQLPIVTPLAAPEQAGCVTRLVQNYSTRRGVRPRIFVLHYTVSPNRPGWSDVNAVVSEFGTVAFQASSNYVMDNEGHCAYIVRESDKAWTQAALNPVSISVEVINTGSEPTYIGAGPGLKKLGQVGCASMKRWEIPLQVGEVVGGVVKRAGLVDHNMLGAAGGGHHDITPYSIGQVLVAIEKACAPPKPKPVPRVAPAVLRAKTGEWSWIAWRFGQAAWRGYPKADAVVRPHVAKAVPAAWWADAAAHAGAHR